MRHNNEERVQHSPKKDTSVSLGKMSKNTCSVVRQPVAYQKTVLLVTEIVRVSRDTMRLHFGHGGCPGNGPGIGKTKTHNSKGSSPNALQLSSRRDVLSCTCKTPLAFPSHPGVSFSKPYAVDSILTSSQQSPSWLTHFIMFTRSSCLGAPVQKLTARLLAGPSCRQLQHHKTESTP